MHNNNLIFFGTILFAILVFKDPCVGFYEPSKFIIKTKKTDDKVTIQIEKNLVSFVVLSPSGISQAIIERNEEKWPESVLIKLKLKGLENFRATNEKEILQAAVFSTGNPHKIRVWKDNDEKVTLDSKNSSYIDIRILNSTGHPTDQIPLEDGTFAVRLPKVFFKNNPKSITISWIDFYRK